MSIWYDRLWFGVIQYQLGLNVSPSWCIPHCYLIQQLMLAHGVHVHISKFKYDCFFYRAQYLGDEPHECTVAQCSPEYPPVVGCHPWRKCNLHMPLKWMLSKSISWVSVHVHTLPPTTGHVCTIISQTVQYNYLLWSPGKLKLCTLHCEMHLVITLSSLS